MLSASLSPPASEQAQEPLALYVHWPFCVSKCPYCDFNSHVRDEMDMIGWRKALLADLSPEAELLPGGRRGDRKGDVWGKSMEVREDIGGSRVLPKKRTQWRY